MQISRRTGVCAAMLAGEAPAAHSSSRTVFSKDARLALYCNRVPRLRAARPGPSLAQKRRSFRMTLSSIDSAEPSPFKAAARAGRSRLHYPAGRTRASAPTWTVQMSRRIRVCASMLAGEAPAPHSSSHTVASKDARLAPYCNHVPRLRAGTRPGPSLAQKRRSFRMTTLKFLYWPG